MYRVLCKDLEIQDIYDMPWVSEESGAQGERQTHKDTWDASWIGLRSQQNRESYPTEVK